jgi:hypothetical protein
MIRRLEAQRACRHRPQEEILLEEPYRTVYPQAWAQQANPVCVRKCAKM